MWEIQLCRSNNCQIVNMRLSKIFNARLSLDICGKNVINLYISMTYLSFYELMYLEKVFLHLKIFWQAVVHTHHNNLSGIISKSEKVRVETYLQCSIQDVKARSRSRCGHSGWLVVAGRLVQGKQKMRDRRKRWPRGFSLNLYVRDGLLGVPKYKKRDVREQSYSVNESCSRSWQDSTRPPPSFCILPVALTDFVNAYRKMPSVAIDISSAARPTQNPEINS